MPNQVQIKRESPSPTPKSATPIKQESPSQRPVKGTAQRPLRKQLKAIMAARRTREEEQGEKPRTKIRLIVGRRSREAEQAHLAAQRRSSRILLKFIRRDGVWKWNGSR